MDHSTVDIRQLTYIPGLVKENLLSEQKRCWIFCEDFFYWSTHKNVHFAVPHRPKNNFKKMFFCLDWGWELHQGDATKVLWQNCRGNSESIKVRIILKNNYNFTIRWFRYILTNLRMRKSWKKMYIQCLSE